jgi:hypothetical protein
MRHLGLDNAGLPSRRGAVIAASHAAMRDRRRGHVTLDPIPALDYAAALDGTAFF